MSSLSLIGDLPNDILRLVLLELDWRDIITLQRVGTRVRDLIREDVALKYKIEIGASGTVDNRHVGPVFVVDRLTLLLARERTKLDLEWKTRSVVSKRWGAFWDLCAGVLAQGINNAEGVDFYFTRLKSSVTEEHSWSFTVLFSMGSFSDFTMDPNQDLLVVVSQRQVEDMIQPPVVVVNLCRLHSEKHEPHPEARLPILFERQFLADNRYPQICVWGPFVGVLSRDHGSLMIWNWKEGNAVFHQRTEAVTFAFLSERFVLVVKGQPDNVSNLNVFDLESPRAACTMNALDSHERIAEFALPRLRDEAVLDSIEIRCNPSSSFGDRTFAVSHHQSMLVMVLNALSSGGEFGFNCQYTLFVPRATFLKHLHGHVPQDGQISLPKVILWDVWGPNGSRMPELSRIDDGGWICNSYGLTYAYSEYSGSPQQVILLDFAPSSVRNFVGEVQHDPESPDEPSQNLGNVTTTLIRQPTCIPHQFKPFAEDITTNLPYRRTVINDDLPNYGVMLTEDSLIVVPKDNEEFLVLGF